MRGISLFELNAHLYTSLEGSLSSLVCYSKEFQMQNSNSSVATCFVSAHLELRTGIPIPCAPLLRTPLFKHTNKAFIPVTSASTKRISRQELGNLNIFVAENIASGVVGMHGISEDKCLVSSDSFDLSGDWSSWKREFSALL